MSNSFGSKDAIGSSARIGKKPARCIALFICSPPTIWTTDCAWPVPRIVPDNRRNLWPPWRPFASSLPRSETIPALIWRKPTQPNRFPIFTAPSSLPRVRPEKARRKERPCSPPGRCRENVTPSRVSASLSKPRTPAKVGGLSRPNSAIVTMPPGPSTFSPTSPPIKAILPRRKRCTWRHWKSSARSATRVIRRGCWGTWPSSNSTREICPRPEKCTRNRSASTAKSET